MTPRITLGREHSLGVAWRRLACLIASLTLVGDASASTGACEEISVPDAKYTVCRFDARSDRIELFYSDSNGLPFRTFAALSAKLSVQGQALAFAMNAGMYHEDRSPVGLFIGDGVTRTPANTGAAAGNFYLKPNGVFFISKDRTGVMETAAFLRSGITPRYATQSGPLLVLNGMIHEKFKPESISRNIRNGVGVDDDGHSVVFAISNAPVTFHSFAVLFRDRLGVKNALYLDGAISRLYAPELNRNDLGADMGPIVGVTVDAESHTGARP
jgi:uncharacterized protein YigE (DUF2233 family)